MHIFSLSPLSPLSSLSPLSLSPLSFLSLLAFRQILPNILFPAHIFSYTTMTNSKKLNGTKSLNPNQPGFFDITLCAPSLKPPSFINPKQVKS